MLKSYEAIHDHGQIRWLETPPDVDEARVIVTVLPCKSGNKAVAPHPVQPKHSFVLQNVIRKLFVKLWIKESSR